MEEAEILRRTAPGVTQRRGYRDWIRMDAETWKNPAEDGLLSLVIKSEYQWPI